MPETIFMPRSRAIVPGIRKLEDGFVFTLEIFTAPLFYNSHRITDVASVSRFKVKQPAICSQDREPQYRATEGCAGGGHKMGQKPACAPDNPLGRLDLPVNCRPVSQPRKGGPVLRTGAFGGRCQDLSDKYLGADTCRSGVDQLPVSPATSDGRFPTPFPRPRHRQGAGERA